MRTPTDFALAAKRREGVLLTHLEWFAIGKDLLTEKRKCQVLFCQTNIGEKCGNKQNHPVKIDSLFI